MFRDLLFGLLDVIDRRLRTKRPEMRIVDPQIFIEKIIEACPGELDVHIFGTDSGGCEFDLLATEPDGPGTLYRVIFFPEMHPFPPIYRVLVAQHDGCGTIRNPLQVLEANRHTLLDYIGIERLEKAVGIQPVPEQLAEA